MKAPRIAKTRPPTFQTELVFVVETQTCLQLRLMFSNPFAIQAPDGPTEFFALL